MNTKIIAVLTATALVGTTLANYRVAYDFESNWSGSIAPSFADRVYTGTPNQNGGPESLATMTQAVGQGVGGSNGLLLGSSPQSPIFPANSATTIAGVRIALNGENPSGYDLSYYQQFVGNPSLNGSTVQFDNAERRLYEQAMQAQFNPYMSVDFNYVGNDDVQFYLFALSPNAGVTVGRTSASFFGLQGNAFANTSTVVNAGWNNLRVELGTDGFMRYQLNGTTLYTTTNTYSLFSNPWSGSLTMEVRGVGGGSVLLDNFEYGSSYNPVPEPMTMTVLALGAAAVARKRRKAAARA